MPPKFCCFFFFFFFNLQQRSWLVQDFFKKIKLWRLPGIEASTLKYRVPPLWPPLYRWKEDNICQSIWDESEVLRRTCWGMHWELGEHIENQGKMKKNPSPIPNWKGKKVRHLHCMLGPSHWLHEISLSKRVCHHFWPGLICPCKEQPTYYPAQINSGYNESLKFKPDPVFVKWNSISIKGHWVTSM
jgi:hypothetical protein